MHIHRLHIAVTASLVVLLCAAVASAQRPKRVGIVIGVQVNVEPKEAMTLASELGAVIQSEFGVDVIAGEETERRLPEGGVPSECVATSECRNELGRRLEADELLMLVIIRLGDDIQIDSTWANVASGDTASRPRILLRATDNRARVLSDAAPRLLPHVKKPLAEPRNPEIIIVPQTTQSKSEREIPLGSWIAGGIGTAALVGGTVLALSARQKFESLDGDGCREMTCEQGRIDSLDNRALGADILFGVSGVAIATAVVLYLTNTPKTTQQEVAPSFTVGTGPGTVGLSIGGGF